MCVCVCVSVHSFGMSTDEGDNGGGGDFYMVLPSNACGETHPDNTASKYFVSWKNPIELREPQKWTVALIEANMEYPKFALVKGHSIYYRGSRLVDIPQCEQRLKIKFSEDQKTISYEHVSDASKNWVFPWQEGIKLIHFRRPEVRVRKSAGNLRVERYVIELTSPFPFEAAFRVDESNPRQIWQSAQPMQAQEGKGYILISDDLYYKVTQPEGREIGYSVKFKPHKSPWEEEVAVEKTATAKDVFALCRLVKHDFAQIIDNCSIQSDGSVMMLFKKGVHSVEFRNGLHKVLGFAKIRYDFKNDDIQNALYAEQHPQLNLGIQYVYIYSSLTAPINVGGVLVPLLRSVCLAGKHAELSHGQMINHVMEHPMYIPLAQTIINSVEIDIRSNSGELIPFGEGAVTTLTLHFKKRS